MPALSRSPIAFRNFGNELLLWTSLSVVSSPGLQAGREAVSANRTSLPIKANSRAGHLSWRPYISEKALAALLNA